MSEILQVQVDYSKLSKHLSFLKSGLREEKAKNDELIN